MLIERIVSRTPGIKNHPGVMFLPGHHVDALMLTASKVEIRDGCIDCQVGMW